MFRWIPVRCNFWIGLWNFGYFFGKEIIPAIYAFPIYFNILIDMMFFFSLEDKQLLLHYLIQKYIYIFNKIESKKFLY